MIVQSCVRGAGLGLPLIAVAALAFTLSGCARWRGVDTSGTVSVDAGGFLMGSTLDERAEAVELSHASRGRVTPEATLWLKQEFRPTQVDVAAFRIMTRPVTQRDYFAYMMDTGQAEPYVDESTWDRLALGHDYTVVERALWPSGGPSPQRVEHPVVLVSQREALDYCVWWGKQRNGRGWLPSEAQWEKAARGDDGRTYPWGNEYNPGWLNSADAGPGDTVPVGSFPEGASPYGVLDMAGNVFEWTSTPAGAGQYVVKGGAWNSDGSTARAAARHARPEALRHVAVGFRCVLAEPAERKRVFARSKKKSESKSRSASKNGSRGKGKGASSGAMSTNSSTKRASGGVAAGTSAKSNVAVSPAGNDRQRRERP